MITHISALESVREKLKMLRLKTPANNIQQILERAGKQNLSALQVIENLLDLELEHRRQCRIHLKFKQSKLFEKPTIDQFDFHFHPSRAKQKSVILDLIDMGFIKQKKDIIFIGHPGVGKSFLAKCLAYAATQTGLSALFTTAMDMINHLVAAEADRLLLKKLHLYQSPELLVIDEIGYLSLGNQGSNLFFQVISGRHEKNQPSLQRTYRLRIGGKSLTVPPLPRLSPTDLFTTRKSSSSKEPAIEKNQKQNNDLIEK